MCVWLPLVPAPSHTDGVGIFVVSLSRSLLLFKGGAPNYYPNSFSAPEQQRSALEHHFQCSTDVQRFNSANEDNVTQVTASLAPWWALGWFSCQCLII